VFGDSPDSPAWAERREPEVPHLLVLTCMAILILH
jgi:hypothetical protein